MKKFLFLFFTGISLSLFFIFAKNTPSPVYAACSNFQSVGLTVSPRNGTSYTATISWPSGFSPVTNDPYEQAGARIGIYNGNTPVSETFPVNVGTTQYELPLQLASEESGTYTVRVRIPNENCDLSDSNPTITVDSGATQPTGRFKNPGEACNPSLQNESSPIEYRCGTGLACKTGPDGLNQCTCSRDSAFSCSEGKTCENVSGDSFCVAPESDSDSNTSDSSKSEYYMVFSLDVANEKKDRVIRGSVTGLDPNKGYMICHSLDTRECTTNAANPKGPSDDLFTEIETNGTTASFSLCGAGEDKIKVNECDPNRDYFHGGNTYGAILYETERGGVPLARDSVYVTRYYPGITINDTHVITESNTTRSDINDPDNVVLDNKIMFPVANFSKEPFSVGNSIKVQVLGARPNEEKDERNDYQVVLEAQNYQYKEEDCKTVELFSSTERRSDYAIFGEDSDDPVKTLGQGTYILKIHDRVNAGTFFRRNDCQGGFLYYRILFDLEKNPDKSGFVMRIRDVIIDPDKTDVNAVTDGSNSKSDSPLPCAEYDEVTETCLQVNIPFLGVIGTKPIEFLMTLGQRILAIATLAAFVVMIYAGYQILVSRGDKEKVANARELITSAVTGLIFIVLSVALLEIIGVDILRIPGFSRENPAPETREADPTPIPTLPPGRPNDRGN